MDKNLIPVFRILYRWRKILISATIIAAVLSIILALSLPVYYKSDTVFYAASPDLGKPEKIFGFTSTDMQYFGTDDDVDRILSMSSSTDLQDFLIDSFQLMEYYDISPDQRAARTSTRKELADDLNIMKTEEGAIQLSMVHQDPEKAADIALAARNYIEKNILEIFKEGQRRVVSTFKSSIQEKSIEMEMLADTLNFIRDNYGIIDPASQGEVLASLIASTESRLQESRAQLDALRSTRGISRDTIALLSARVAGLENKMEGLTDTAGGSYSNIRKYHKGLNDFLYFEQKYKMVKNDLTNESRRLQYYESAINATAPGLHVIEEVKVPERKFKPSRSLIVILSTLGTFIFAVLIVLLIETFNKFPWEQVTDGS